MSRFNNPVKLNKAILTASAAIASSIGAFCIEIFPHSFAIQKYQDFVNIYRLGEKVKLNDELEQLYNVVLDDLKVSDQIRRTFRPFPVIGYDLFYAGMSESNYGAIIGIPNNFTYKDTHSVDTSKIIIGSDKESINMHHPAAEDMVESLVLSQKAKKFGIAREVLMAQKNLPLYRAIESALLVATSVIMADYACVQYKIKSKSSIIMVYGASALLGFSVWFQIRDTLTRYYEKDVDAKLANLGPSYIEGGKQFYEKLLKRNVAYRKLTGKEGSSQFNRDGDEIFFLRNKRTPITHRQKFFNEFKFQGERIPA